MTPEARAAGTSGRARRIALAAVGVASPLALACLVVPELFPGSSAAWVFALLTAVLPAALMALGAPGGDGRRGRAARAIQLGLAVVLAGGALGVLALSGASSEGLPTAAIVQVVGLWLLPLPLATLGYALAFDRTGLGRRELDALRRRFRRVSDAGPDGGSGRDSRRDG